MNKYHFYLGETLYKLRFDSNDEGVLTVIYFGDNKADDTYDLKGVSVGENFFYADVVNSNIVFDFNSDDIELKIEKGW